jgi:HK97 family phage prohead protease
MAPQHAQQSTTRNIEPLTLRAAFAPSSLDEEKRTVDLVWTTGARVMRGFFDRFWEELSTDPQHIRMGRLLSGAPLLSSHNGYSLRGVIGVVESASVENGQGVAQVRFAKAEDNDEAGRIFRMVQDGVIRNVSVGYRVHRYEKGERGDDDIPVYRATDWEPYEISMVPMGADAGAGVRAEGADTNPCEFVELAQQERRMHEKDATTAAPPASQTKTEERTNPIDEKAVREEERQTERKRSADIRRTARALGLSEEFVERHIVAGTKAEEFRGLAIDEYEQQRKPHVSDAGRIAAVPGGDERDKWLRGAEAWVLQRSGARDIVAKAAAKRGEKVEFDPGQFRGMTLRELARAVLERSGVRTAGVDPMRLVSMALEQRGNGGYAATGDFPVLLENVLKKTLLGSYEITPDTWSRFCGVGSVSDFRAHYRYRLGSFGVLDDINEGGEYKNKAIPDGEKQTISAGTKGNIIAITRQALINDDMGAFSSLATMLGRAAALTIERAVYALLAQNSGAGPTMSDSNPFFHSSRNNVGTAATITMAAIEADSVVMASQTDPSGNDILDLSPSVLLVPKSLEGTARTINDSQYDPDTANKLQKPNTVRYLFSDIVGTARLTGTRRYLFVDPNLVRAIEVAFLDGQRGPVMEMQEGHRVDGIEWKIRIDFGVAALDHRGALTNAGAP